MTKQEILDQFKRLADPQTKKTLMRHGAKEPVYGVRVGDMKPLQKKIKKDYKLALELFATGIPDVMYFAGLIADESKMTKKDLQSWVKKAYTPWVVEYTVPWVASESSFGVELGKEWIESKNEIIAAAGWMTFASLVGITPDEKLNLKDLEKLLARVAKEISTAPNRVRLTMNAFVIAVGSYVKPLTTKAVETAKKMGKVEADMGDTDCKIPDAAEYIAKSIKTGRHGRKRASARC